jgi:hypothetical protein
MSAFPSRADMLSVEVDVCFVPEADIVPNRQYDLVFVSALWRARNQRGEAMVMDP